MSTVVSRMGRKSSTPRRSDSVAVVTSSTSPTAPRNPAARSTRSTGQATHFKPLDGAPPPERKRRPSAKAAAAAAAAQETVAMSATKSRTVTPKKRPASSSTPPKKSAARPAKRACALPTPEPEDQEEDEHASSDDDHVSEDEQHDAKEKSAPPARKRAQRTAHLPLPSPAATPPKRPLATPSKFAPKVPSPLKPKQRRIAPASSDDDRIEGDLTTIAAGDNGDVFDSTPASSSTATDASTPRKSTTSTPRTTPSRSGSVNKATPGSSSRSSSRIQHLPPAIVDIKNAPASLRSRLVGFHMEDEGYGLNKAAGPTRGDDGESETGSEAGASDEDVEEQLMAQRRRDAKGKGRMMMDEDEELDGSGPPAPRDPFALLDEDEDEDVEMDLSLPIPPPQFSSGPALDYDETDVSQGTPRASTSAATTPLAKRHPLLPSAPDRSYLASPLRKHILSSLAVLSGARLPLPTKLPEASTCDSIMGLPCMAGGYDEWERPLRGALDECVTKGMGNAVMLLGPRGVGKTMLVERSLKLLSHVHGSDAFVTVRLSGLVHTTDRLAMRSIAVQLAAQGFASSVGKEGEADDGDYSSNSATMATLLRLLEPSSPSNASTAGGDPHPSTSAAAAASATSKPLVIIVDEFDLFAQHPRQSFLYCLLDIVQGNRRRGGVAVIGVSARVDCLSLLEKRVRSRCQSHVLQMIPPSSFAAFCELGRRLLLVDSSEAAEQDWAMAWNAEVERFFVEKRVVEYLRRMWSINGNVPTELRSTLSHLLYRLDYDLKTLGLPENSPRLSIDMLKPQAKGEDKVRDDVLKQLSLPELTALVAAKHLTSSTLDRHAGFNFEMLYDAYVEHSRRVAASTSSSFALTHKPLSKAALRAAFDSLRSHELLLARTSSSTSATAVTTASAGGGMAVAGPGSAAYIPPVARDPWKMYRLTVWAREVDREVEARGAECPLALRRWCKNWLD